MSIEVMFGDTIVEVSIGDGAAVLDAIQSVDGRVDAAETAIDNLQHSVETRDTESKARDTALDARIDLQMPRAGGVSFLGRVGFGNFRQQDVGDPQDDTDGMNRRSVVGLISALFDTIKQQFLPLSGGKTLGGSLGLGGFRLQTLGDAMDGKDAMNRDMVYARADPLEGAVSRGFMAGFRPGSSVPIAEATVDANGFLIEADGMRDFEPQAQFFADAQVIVQAAEIDLGGGRLFRTTRGQLASPALNTAGYRRKDIISANPLTGSLSITLGIERPTNAAYWTNPIPAGRIEIGRVLRTADGAFYTPTWRRRAGLHSAQAVTDAFWLETSRAATTCTRSRLQRGLPVRVIAYGDSRMAIGGNNAFAQLNTHPNSDAAANPPYLRDIPGYFETYDNDTRARVLDQGRDFGDGHGPVHSREGYVWRMLRTLETAFGTTFSAGPNPTGSSYRNWAVGGTDSGTGVITADPAGNQRANGREPARLNAMLNDIIAGQTLVVLGFGMNEIGSANTYANLVALAQACSAAGADVMMVTSTRPLGTWNSSYAAINAWRLTCRETVRAALDTGSAWVDVSSLVAPEWLAALGVTEAEIADATNTNHDGVSVQAAIGQRAARILTGG